MPQINEKETDIAVIGMAGRFPMAANLEEFWSNLEKGRDCIGNVPAPRLVDWRPMFGETLDPTFQFGYLEEISRFDAAFFNIPPGEAPLLDPTQRLLLEIVYEALEQGGYGGTRLAGTRTGVFLACGNSNYRELISRADYSKTAEVGNLPAVSAGRVSHTFDLRGPSLLVDTACSSSLAAVHFACESIKSGQCSLAVVGTANVYAYMDGKGAQAESGDSDRGVKRGKVFDNDADGMLNGEGAAALLLKPLDQALKDNDIINAVIKGSALNHNGARTPTVSGQKPEALAEVIQEALENAQINPDTLSYIEASGAASRMGDPIEIRAIADVFARYTEKKQFCAIGSVKTNVGHLNHASGMAGLLKVILALQHKQIPPHIHFKEPNTYIDFKNSPVYVETHLKYWEAPGAGPRRAGVSSFSLSGANCHVIVEESPTANAADTADTQPGKTFPDRYHILPISARTMTALQKIYSALKEITQPHDLDADNAPTLGDICFTQGAGRGHYEYRLALMCKDKEQLRQQLSEPAPSVTAVKPLNRDQAGAVFLFSGYREGMEAACRDFMNKAIPAARYMEECNAIFPLENDPRLLYFAFQYALARLLQDIGITPAFVLGFGIGKYVSKVISGSLPLTEALEICRSNKGDSQENNFNKDKFIQNIELVYPKVRGLFLEIGTANTLGAIARETLATRTDARVLDTYGSEDKEKILLETIAQLYTMGMPIDFSVLFPGKRVTLPVYPFEGTRYWISGVTNITGVTALSTVKPSGAVETTVEPLRMRPQLSAEYAPPQTDFEKQFAGILQQFLGIREVGIHDSFFELGINSLSLLHVNNILKAKIQKDIPIVAVFEHPTIRTLGQYLEGLERESAVKPVDPAQISAPVQANAGIMLRNSANLLRDRKKSAAPSAL
jgi:acyl transferase domain-containing protein